jgi:TRAP-type C4-dicarboxylate transport system permease small subunit
MTSGRIHVIWKVINGALIATLGSMALMVFTNAFLRYAFNSGIPACEELSRYLFVWVSALGTIVAYREGRHIGVDFLIVALRGTARKAVILAGQVMILGTFLLVLWGGWEFLLTSAASPGPATEIPFGFVSVSIIVVALSIIAMTLSQCIQILREKPDADPQPMER